MPFQEVSRQGWGSRIGGSIMGALAGVLLFFASFPVLWINEGRAVDTERGLAESSKAVVSVDDANKVDPANNGQLIHFMVQAVTDETPTDPDFGVQAPKALRLARKVEMYQYKEEDHPETKKTLGGGEETVHNYSYPLEWSETFHDSSEFHDPNYRGKNPSAMPYESHSWQAKKITAGAFTLSDNLASQIKGEEKLPVADKSAAPKLPKNYAVQGDAIYKGQDPSSPTVGDVRVTYTVVKPATVSVLARQQEGGLLGPYQAPHGPPLERLDMGDHRAADMFGKLNEENNTLTWILRLVGYLMMAIGIFLVFKPLAVLGDVVPFIGNMVGGLLAVIAGMIALGFSLITISLAWLFFRPLIGVPLLLAGIAGIVLVVLFARRKRAPATGTAG